MNKISYMLSYYIYYYPYPDELTKTRCTKMIYLADWFSVIKNNKQITEIEWYFDHYGPYVEDVYNVAKNEDIFYIEKSQSYFGNTKEIFRLSPSFKPEINLLNTGENLILNEVIEQTKYLNWNEFIKMVYQTYPIESQKKYTFLNLVELKSKI